MWALNESKKKTFSQNRAQWVTLKGKRFRPHDVYKNKGNQDRSSSKARWIALKEKR